MTDSICVGCGICCDGTLFRHLPIALGDKREVLEAAGSVIATVGTSSVMLQGCGAFDGQCCTIYAHRPTVCGTFTCALYRRHAAGEVTTEDAKVAIAETIALRDIVRPAVEEFLGLETPSTNLVVLFDQLAAVFADAPDADAAKQANHKLLLYVSGLQLRLRTMFRNDSPVPG